MDETKADKTNAAEPALEIRGGWGKWWASIKGLGRDSLMAVVCIAAMLCMVLLALVLRR
jgi:hypothetical protein